MGNFPWTANQNNTRTTSFPVCNQGYDLQHKLFGNDRVHTSGYRSVKQHQPRPSYVKAFKACNTPYPLTKVRWQAATVNDELSVRGEPWWTFTTARFREEGFWTNRNGTIQCLQACAGQTRARSQVYEWKEGICHFFTIFGHVAVQREKALFMKLRIKTWQQSPGEGAETAPHCLQRKFNAHLEQLFTALWFNAADWRSSVQSFCLTQLAVLKSSLRPNIL